MKEPVRLTLRSEAVLRSIRELSEVRTEAGGSVACVAGRGCFCRQGWPWGESWGGVRHIRAIPSILRDKLLRLDRLRKRQHLLLLAMFRLALQPPQAAQDRLAQLLLGIE